MISQKGILLIMARERFEEVAKIKAYCRECKSVFNGIEILHEGGICPNCGNTTWELGEPPKKGERNV